MRSVRVRFAPSPTGFLHLGGLRTALFNAVFAKQHGGAFVLRIEDTDQSRLVPGASEALERSLAWAGISIDEGPTAGGMFGPYVQSQRLALYRQHADMLLSTGAAYRCFCSEERLTLVRNLAARQGRIPAYDGACRHLAATEVGRRLEARAPFTVRLAGPSAGSIMVTDAVYGQVSFDHSQVDDQILLKTGGFPTYHLANVVDDHAMQISHVIRGEEWLSSTPKHALLYDAFGWTPPIFAHIPLLVNKDRSKLSKRQNDLHVASLAEAGTLPSALNNFLIFLGWSSPQAQSEVYESIDAIAKDFSLENVSKSQSVVDMAKLHFLDKKHQQILFDQAAVVFPSLMCWLYFLRLMGSACFENVVDVLMPQVARLYESHSAYDGPTTPAARRLYLQSVMNFTRGNSESFGAMVHKCSFFWLKPTYDAAKVRGEGHVTPQSVAVCALLLGRLCVPGTCGSRALSATAFNAALHRVAVDAVVDPPIVQRAVRLALTGGRHGPAVGVLAEALGRDRVLARLGAFLTACDAADVALAGPTGTSAGG